VHVIALAEILTAAVGEMGLVAVGRPFRNCTQIEKFENFIYTRAGLTSAAPHIMSVGK
jgi:hypothetical protein